MHDGVTEPDALGHHRRGRQKLLRTGQMGVARQEVMLDGDFVNPAWPLLIS
jgi:hypothetical protein